MVGDDVTSDIGGARRAGLRTVFVRTGKHGDAELRGRGGAGEGRLRARCRGAVDRGGRGGARRPEPGPAAHERRRARRTFSPPGA